MTAGGDGEEHSDRGGDIGVAIRVIDGQALVTDVYADSPAQEAGVHAGWVVTAVDGKELAPVLERITKAYGDKHSLDYVLSRSVSDRLIGEIGTPVELKMLDGDDQPVTETIERGPRRGNKSKFGHMPEVYVWSETKTIDDNVGYFALNIFFDLANVMQAFEEAIHSFRDADGIIIDLRGNPGGIGVMAMGMAGWFFEETNHYLGTMQMRGTSLKFVVNPRLEPYEGPVAVLVDGLSASTAEIMASGLQDLGRARVFGTPTAAAALPSRIERLPNGDGFQYATANYVSASGRTLEGNGVAPDEEVHLTRKALLAGRDPVIEAAIAWIKQQ